MVHKEHDFIWERIRRVPYSRRKVNQSFSRSVYRQNLVETSEQVSFDVRYFSCGPDGYTRLEKHDHAHVVIVLQGKGRVLIGDVWHFVKPFDCIVIPGGAAHQLINKEDVPFGFICMVDKDRDIPKVLDRGEIEKLLEHAGMNRNLHIPDGYLD